MHPLWFVPLAAILAIGSKAPAAVAMSRLKGGYDNRRPREQQEQLSGWGKRAHAAHLNTLESFPIFAICLITGYLLQADPGHLVLCSILFFLSRLLYIYFYIIDQGNLRSTVWLIGLLASLASAVLGLVKV